MLEFSGGERKDRAAMPALEQPFTPDAAPLARKHPPRTAMTPPMPQERCKVVQMGCDVDDAEFMNDLLPLFQQARPCLLYLYGYNSTPAAFFERCDRLQSLYGLEIVRFSWSSKKHLVDDGFRPGFDAAMDTGMQCELASLFGPQGNFSSGPLPEPLCPVVCDLEKVTCSWWVLTAFTSMRH